MTKIRFRSLPSAAFTVVIAQSGTQAHLSRGSQSAPELESGSDPTPDPVPPEPEPIPETPESDPTPITQPEPPSTAKWTPSPIGVTSAIAGRACTLASGLSDVETMSIATQPAHGHASVNPDNTIALVLSGDSYQGPDSLAVAVTYQGGAKARETISYTIGSFGKDTPPNGWGEGRHYLLRTDANGTSVVEPGPGHVDVYLTKGSGGWTAARIAAAEGVAASVVTGAWLAKQGRYGRSESFPLDVALGWAMWDASVGIASPVSAWLHLERGHDYRGTPLTLNRWWGLSPLHPVMIRAWGSGTPPKFPYVSLSKNPYKNIVLKDLWLVQGMSTDRPADGTPHENIMLEGVLAKAEGDLGPGAGNLNLVAIDSVEGFSVRHSFFLDSPRSGPRSDKKDPQGRVVWEGNDNRRMGLFGMRTMHLLFDGVLLDHCGWAEGYHTESLGSYPHPPSMFTHNAYFSEVQPQGDFKFRDLVSMRSSSHGIKNQCGGVYHQTVWIENNSGFMCLGDSNFAWIDDCVVTSAGCKRADYEWVKDGQTVKNSIGALAYPWNVSDSHTHRQVIVAHGRNPADPAEKQLGNPVGPHPDTKKDDVRGEFGLMRRVTGSRVPYYFDGLLYRWIDASNEFTEGINTATADATTIQNFAAKELGLSDNSVVGLAKHLRGLPSVARVARAINAYFQKGFGRYTEPRTTAATLRFAPDPRANGTSWDERVHWSTNDLPGTVAGDHVDLGGNRVTYCWSSNGIAEVNVGGGHLTVWGGYLGLTGDIHGGTVTVEYCGQLWVEGHSGSGSLALEVTGGRFGNTGAFRTDLDMTVSGGEVLLGFGSASFALPAGSVLAIEGREALVGFDGLGGEAASLTIEAGATLRFVAAAGGFGTIAEFMSGRGRGSNPAAPNVVSTVNLGGTLQLDLSALSGTGAHTIIEVDKVTGTFAKVDVIGANGRTVKVTYGASKVQAVVS